MAQIEIGIRRQSLVGALPWFLVPAATTGIHLWLMSGLDLRGVPGAAGPELVHAVAVEWVSRDLGVWVVHRVLPLFGGDHLAATQAMMLVSGIWAVLGVMLAAWSLLGTRAAIVAGLVTALWSQTAFVWLMLSNDGMAWGIAWLGVGAAWAFARKGAWGVAGVFVAALLTLFGAAVKVSALPMVAFLFLAPFLVEGRRPWPARVATTAVIALAIVTARLTFLSGHATGPVLALPDLSPLMIPRGLGRLVTLTVSEAEGLILAVLFALAAAGALIPAFGPRRGRWPQRALLAGVTCLALAYLSETCGYTLRVRYLTIPAFPLIVLAGCAVANVQQAVDWYIVNLLKLPVRMLAWLIPLTLLVPLSLDNIGFLHAWSEYREAGEGAQPAELPESSSFWTRYYKRFVPHPYFDVTAVGGISMFELGADAPSAGVVIVPLRDAHEHHLLAGAALANKPAHALEPMWCCADERPSETCARAMVAAVDRAGMRLVLPASIKQFPHPDRVDPQHHEWTTLLFDAAADSLERVDLWWYVMDGTGSGDGVPCPEAMLWEIGDF